MQVNRLFEITYLLLEREIISAKELAERFEVSTRTIYRDIEVLSTSGVPVYMKKGKNGGISLLPNFTLDKTLLNSDEKSLIISALNNINTLNTLEVKNILSKLESFFDKSNKNFIEIDYVDWGNFIKEQFEKSKFAILQNRELAFNYISSNNILSERIVEPYILLFKDRSWYLKAYCLEKNAFRVFKLTRMRDIIIRENIFNARKIEEDDKNEITGYEYIKVTMRIETEAEYRVFDEFQESNIVKNDDGSFLVTFDYPENEWLYSYILSFGTNAVIIEPQELKERIKIRLKDMIEKYY